MLIIDVVVLVMLVVAFVIGVQRGFFASVGSLVGLAAGGLAALWLVPIVNNLVPWNVWRGWIVLAVAVGLLVLGATIGSAIGGAIRRGADKLKLKLIERVLGGAVSLAVAALTLSLVGQSVAATGMPIIAPAVASSQVLRTIDALTPRPVTATLAELRGAVMEDGIPRLGQLLGPATAPAAPDIQLDDPALNAAAQSVARVSGIAYACGISATGSGFVIADGLVVTNAHVVAGVDQPIIELPGREAREGRVVYFDAVDDLAVVAVSDLDGTPLPISDVLDVGASAVVQGYPLGGPFTATAAQVLSVGTVPVPGINDGASAPRDVYSLAAAVRPGNSGGPLLTLSGEVAGVVFARSDNDDNLGYAMTSSELMPILTQAGLLDDTVSSGTCTTPR